MSPVSPPRHVGTGADPARPGRPHRGGASSGNPRPAPVSPRPPPVSPPPPPVSPQAPPVSPQAPPVSPQAPPVSPQPPPVSPPPPPVSPQPPPVSPQPPPVSPPPPPVSPQPPPVSPLPPVSPSPPVSPPPPPPPPLPAPPVPPVSPPRGPRRSRGAPRALASRPRRVPSPSGCQPGGPRWPPAMPLLRRPPGGGQEDGDPFATNPESRRRRRATLGGLVGLGGQLGQLGGHLGQLGGPFGRARRPRDPAGPRGRRRSEDSGVPRRPPEEAGGGKRGSLLRLALGTWGQRGTEKVSPVEGQAGDSADGAGQRPESGGRDKDGDREPLSVLEILELIQRRELVAADAQIIALEAECALSPSRPPSPCPPLSPSSAGSPPPSPGPAGGRRARDVALLYRALLAQLWAVVAEAVAAGRAVAPLRAVVAVLEQEEAADARSPPGTVPGRPRGLRRRWHEAVARAASERLAQVAPAGGLGARLAALAARVVGDLGVVRSHVAPAYPPEYGALGVYARGYHRALAQQLRALAQRPLAVPDLYLLLDWHSNAYPREVLGHPEVGSLLRTQELGPLLPPETQRDLESSCIAAVKAKVEVAVAQELQLSEDTWPEDVTSQDMEEGLATRVTGLLRAHVDRAPQVTPEFGRAMAHSLLGVLVAFLHSFQRKVERFLEAPGELPPPDGSPGRAIALANCCPPFRAFAERLAQFGHPESEEPRRQAHAALDRVTRTCGHVLSRRLFEDLKPHFGKLMKRKWLTSSDAFDSIVMLLTGFAQTLRPLHPEPHQVLVSELHRRVLIEYVRPLLQGRLVCTSAKARTRVAARLGDEARQLRELFTRLDSASPWLDSVVPRLRELLVLEDTAALQMEVGALARDFPDVRRRHVAALLDARGLRAQGPRREILGVLQDLGGPEAEAGPPRHRTFFSELPAPRPVRCLPFHLPRLRLPRRSPARTPP
ncbi:tumor necrosis factor alpha-induced protein 2-like [Poecile atricapillus]|uniref:tumor necrosis factor alpha-induced protein 2-like n=1 Tax=Poecile atricapillus TaxID=48891 RepID=UPI002738DF3E|nr:tumor necrosis factor alpha-induced protein 2-like [Poecile atricapillus]